MGELFDIVDDQDRVIGQAPRSSCHGNPALIHRVAHVLVFNSAGQVLLQKRSCSKDVQPGRWDTSVGGHLDPGEDYQAGALREMAEELGIVNQSLELLYSYPHRNDFESENVTSFWLCYDGVVAFDPQEIEAIAFYSVEEIAQLLGSGYLTPNFEHEWSLFMEWTKQRGGAKCPFFSYLRTSVAIIAILFYLLIARDRDETGHFTALACLKKHHSPRLYV